MTVGMFWLTSLVLGLILFFIDRRAFTDSSEFTISIGWLTALIAIPTLIQVLYVIFAVRRKGRGLSADLAMRFRPVDLAIGIVLFLVAIMVSAILAVAMETIFGISPDAALMEMIDDSDSAATGITGGFVLLAVVVALFVPVAEEIIYRGLLWSALEKRGMREETILLLTSLIFAAAHLEPARFPILFVLGVALGYGRVHTGRIGSCIATHTCLNSTAMIALLVTL